MRRVLTEIEKLGGRFPDLLTTVKTHLDHGRTTAEIPALLHQQFGVSVTSQMVETFRHKRWVPEKDRTAEKKETARAAIEAFGGDEGFDCVVLAKLWELMDKMTIPQLIAARTLFVKIKAQNLKEQEFLFKTGQWKPPKPAGEEDADPIAQSRRAMQRIKEIFGLAGNEPPKPRIARLPEAVSQASAENKIEPLGPA
jgi:hypothetical protein